MKKYPFGMQMPGRHGFATETGTWHGSYAFSIPPYLFVDHRAGNTPLEYVASQTIELSNGFLTGAGSDNYVAYIADSANMAALDSAYQLVGNGYRYGFNGKENDNEVKGEGNELDYGNRIYDPRGGRFLSPDKLLHSQPYYSPYIYAGNKPIWCIDKEGNQEIIVTFYNKQKDGTLVQTSVHRTWTNTVEEAKGIVRDAYKISVVYENQEHAQQVNPSTVISWKTKSLVSVSADEKSGLNKEEQQKRDHPFDYYTEKAALSIFNLFGMVDYAKGLKDENYGYGSEPSGEKITESRAKVYRLSGGVKLVSFFATGVGAAMTNKVGSWGAWQIGDVIYEGLSNFFNEVGLGEKGNNLLYSAIKVGKSFYDLKKGKALVDAIELATDLADAGFKGEELINELTKRGVNMGEDIALDKKDAANKALEKSKKQYQTSGAAAKIE